MIKLTKIVLTFVMLAMFHVPAMAVESNWTWTAPTEGSPTVGYRMQYTVDGSNWIDWPVVLDTNSVSIEMIPNKTYTMQVRAIDANGHPGVWSDVSDPALYTAPGACGKPTVSY
jgi:hypothetical protein